MNAVPGAAPAPASPTDQAGAPAGAERDQITQNIAAVLDFYSREEEKISRSQRVVERISAFVGQPLFLGIIVLFVTAWMLANQVMTKLGVAPFDPAPYFWLQGIVGLGALLTATAVLVKQNRIARLAQQRAHLDLKVTLLTEQKAAKMIHLLEELRRDLPNVRDRHDSGAAALQQSMDPDLVLAALDEHGRLATPAKPAAKSAQTSANDK